MTDNNIYDLYTKAGVNSLNYPMYPSLSYYQQVEIFKILCNGRWIEIAQKAFHEGEWYAGGVDYKRRTYANSFEEVICALILKYWSEINERDKERIKEILCHN